MTSTTSRLRLPALLLLGALALAAGLTLARLWLPEWQGGPLPAEQGVVERYEALARQVGIRLEPGEPRVLLSTGSGDGIADDDQGLDRYGPAVQDDGRSVRV